ncbi:MAG: hypothetical protein ACPGYQ_04450 [Candidatus Puniceispirillales bacterium]
MGRGFISGVAAEYPSGGVEATPLTAVEYLRAERPCLVIFQQPLGAVVRAGDLIAELLSLEGDDAFTGKTLLRAGTDGVFFDRSLIKLAWPDHIVAKIAGKIPLVDDGYLLSD